MPEPALQARLDAWRARVDAALARALPDPDSSPKRLHAAMRHAVLLGGKRMRPLLVYAAGTAFGADEAALDAPSVAVELIHAYSLVHDDLPAMDDDDLRRGQPTTHIAYDEACAILAGDGLQSLAFEALADARRNPADAHLRLSMVMGLARAAALGPESDRNAAPVVPSEHGLQARLLEAASLDRWMEAWEKVAHLLSRADAVNLDRKQTVLGSFLALQSAMR